MSIPGIGSNAFSMGPTQGAAVFLRPRAASPTAPAAQATSSAVPTFGSQTRLYTLSGVNAAAASQATGHAARSLTFGLKSNSGTYAAHTGLATPARNLHFHVGTRLDVQA